MTLNRRLKKRRAQAQIAAVKTIIKDSHIQTCRKFFPDWDDAKVAAAFQRMESLGINDELADLAIEASQLSDEQYAAFTKPLRDSQE
jgi:hypothetical protein